MVTWDNSTLLRLAFVRRTQSSSWTSPFGAALFAQFNGRASASTSGGGSWPTAGEAVRVLLKAIADYGPSAGLHVFRKIDSLERFVDQLVPIA
jgi:hypothetical protein